MAASNGVDTINSTSSADLSSRLSIDTSKIKDKEEPPQNSVQNGGDSVNSMPQDSLSLMQLKRVVGDVSRMRVRLALFS